MQFFRRTKSTSWSFLCFPALVLTFTLAGCDSTPSADSPEVKKQIAERQAQQKKTDEEINALNKKATRGRGAVLKNIKTGINTDQGTP
jgi:hypothetical protein